MKEEDLPSDPPTAAGSSRTLSKSHSTQVVTVILFYTGIDDLLEIDIKLKNLFRWKHLGLALGLLYPTLERIEQEHRRDIEECKTVMLATWLLQQDNVIKIGAPSWAVLRKALKEIGESESIIIALN